MSTGDREAASDCLRAAIEIAEDDIDVSEFRRKLEEIDPSSARRSAAEKIMAGIEEGIGLEEVAPEEGEAVADFGESPEDLFEVYMNAFSGEVADRYRAQGVEFRDAYLKLQEGDFDGAIAGFEALPGALANDPIVRLEKSQALLFAGRQEEALALIEDLALPAELEYRRATMAATLLDRAGRTDEAFAVAEELFRNHPTDVEAASIYADLLIQKGAAEKALAIVKGLIMAGDPSPDLVNLAARAYVAAGRVEEGRDLLEQSLENFFQGPGWRGQTPRFPLEAARELLHLYIALNEEPEFVRAMAQHLVTYDPDHADHYKETLRAYAEARERSQPEA